ncbi:MAG: hypothetical protein WCL39_12985 [Armatimonadota bacterium]
MKDTMMINIPFNLTLEEVAVVRREQKECGKNPHQFTLHTWIEDGVHARIKDLGEAQVAVDKAVAQAMAEMEEAAAKAKADADAAKADAERLCA